MDSSSIGKALDISQELYLLKKGAWLDEDDTDRIVFQRINKDGEVIVNIEKKATSQNGGGFVLSYVSNIDGLLKNIRSAACLRIFFYLAHHQSYGTDGQFGFRCTQQFLADELQLNRKTVYECLVWLRDNLLVLPTVVDGQKEFFVNPNYVTIGRDKRLRLAEWNRRWRAYIKAMGDDLAPIEKPSFAS